MITDGSSALELLLDPKRAEMEAYLSAEDGYWIQNDIWRTDSEAYRASGIKKSRRDGILADLTSCQNAYMKLELKYYILYSLKNQWKSPVYIQDMLMTVIRLIGKNIASGDIFGSFMEIGENTEVFLPEEAEPTVAILFKGFLNGIRAFFADYYDDREETEKDVWHALRVPGVKMSAAMKRQHPSLNFTEPWSNVS